MLNALMKKTTALILTAILLVACGNVTTLSGKRLMELTHTWKEPEVAVWHYTGSSDRYDYFHYHDLGINQAYRVPSGELSLTQRFPLTNDKRIWVVMPWGPLAE